MKTVLSQPGLFYSLGWMAYHLVWQAGLVAGSLWLANRVLRGASPRSRYLCSWVALWLCIVLPTITFLRFYHHADSATGLVRTLNPTAPIFEVGILTFRMSDLGYPILGLKMDETRQAGIISVLIALVGLWLVGSALLLWRLRRRWSVMIWAHHVYGEAPSTVQRMLRQVAAQLGMKGEMNVKQTARTGSPVVIGVWRPIVIVPAGFLARAQPDEARLLLAHELAHIKRGDPWVNLLQCCMETLLFWHPAVLWIGDRIRQERECCCDEMAAVALGSPETLASALANLAAFCGTEPCLSLGANRGVLVQRVALLLDDSFPKPIQPWRLGFALTTMPLTLIGAFAAHVAMGPK